MQQILKLSGSIDVPPQNLVSVSSALGGYVKSTKLLPGMHFSKGEVLAVIEDNQFIQLQQDYLTTKAQWSNALSEYNRQRELNQSKASSDKAYQQAKATYEALEVAQKSLEQKLRLIHINPDKITIDNIRRTANIYAPFDGFVTEVLVNIGKYVAPSDVLFELVDPKDIHLNLKVFEKDLDKIKVGQTLLAYTNNAPEKKYPGEIILIGKALGADKAVEVHAHFENHHLSLIPGMYMNAEIAIQKGMAWSLPEESVLDYNGRHYVFIQLNENKFEMVAVETGQTTSGTVEIIHHDALNGKRVVEKGAYTLLMALKNEFGED